MKLTYNDRQHAYWLDGKRCKSVTAIAKIPDNTFSLNKWRERMIAIGLATQPDLVERAAAHYDDKDVLDDICAEAARAAGAHRKADRGTAAHRITERHDAGELIIETAWSRRIRDAWQQAMEDAGLEVACDSQGRPLQERVVVWPDQLVCGKFDRICRRADGSLVVVDLKTGDGAIRYPHSIAIQLALYAYAPLIAGPLPAGGGSTEEFSDLYSVDDQVALVVHMPDEGPVRVYEFDIAAGADAAFDICLNALAWRKQAALCWPLGTRSDDERQPVAAAGVERMVSGAVDVGRPASEPAETDSVAAGALVRGRPPAGTRPADTSIAEKGNDAEPVAGAGPDAEEDLVEPRREGGGDTGLGTQEDAGAGSATDPAALLADIDALPPDVYQALKRCWPDGVPTPKQVAAGRAEATGLWLMAAAAAVRQAKDACLYLTPAELAARQAKVDEQWEKRRGTQPVAGTGGECAPDGMEPQPQLHDVAAAPLDEGPPADPAAIDALTRNLAALTNQEQNIIKTWLVEAKDAGVFFGNLKGNPTVRRFALARACWALVSHMDGDDELVRLALAFVAGNDVVQPAFPTGAIIGALSPSEADRVYEVVTAYKRGVYIVLFDDDVGRLAHTGMVE